MLLEGYTPEIIGNNISEFVKLGYLHKNAINIALAVARDSYRLEHPTEKFPKHLQGAGKFYRENPVSKKVGKVKRKKNPLKNPANNQAVRELMLFADNESTLYPQKKDIIKNLMRKIKKGTYAHSLAPKLWKYWYDNAAKMYGKQYGGNFSVADRKEAAKQQSDIVLNEIELGEYDFLNLSAKPSHRGKIGANPVRPLKLKNNMYEIRYQKNHLGKVYYYTGKSFDTNKKNRALYSSELAAKNVWRSINGIYHIGNKAWVNIAKK